MKILSLLIFVGIANAQIDLFKQCGGNYNHFLFFIIYMNKSFEDWFIKNKVTDTLVQHGKCFI
jgi:hypothetical protein